MPRPVLLAARWRSPATRPCTTWYDDDPDVEVRRGLLPGSLRGRPGRCGRRPTGHRCSRRWSAGEVARDGAATPTPSGRGRSAGPPTPTDDGAARYDVLRLPVDRRAGPPDAVETILAAGAAGDGRRRVPDRPEWSVGRGRGTPALSTSWSTRTSPSQHLQGPVDHGGAAAPRPGGAAARHARRPAPRRAGSSSATSTGPRRRCSARSWTRLQEAGLLGRRARHRTTASIESRDPGGYILGEETALLEAMEGHRGEPRTNRRSPSCNGLRGQPTLINSVETLAHVPLILARRGGVAGAGPGRLVG